MKEGEHIITAAGGNATAIRVLEGSQDRSWYAREGADLLTRAEALGAEQSGFLVPGERHFEMAGGEVCGNAARSAAVLLSNILGLDSFDFTMSGYQGPVLANVRALGADRFDVSCLFSDLPATITGVEVLDGQSAKLVDLGGIVHVVIEAPFPESSYEQQHRDITEELGLTERGAVGVCWIGKTNDGYLMHPVVWVRAIDSFFYETSCGSGSIAVEVVTSSSRIEQPSGEIIEVVRDDDGITLHSEMEVLHAAS